MHLVEGPSAGVGLIERDHTDLADRQAAALNVQTQGGGGFGGVFDTGGGRLFLVQDADVGQIDFLVASHRFGRPAAGPEPGGGILVDGAKSDARPARFGQSLGWQLLTAVEMPKLAVQGDVVTRTLENPVRVEACVDVREAGEGVQDRQPQQMLPAKGVFRMERGVCDADTAEDVVLVPGVIVPDLGRDDVPGGW